MRSFNIILSLFCSICCGFWIGLSTGCGDPAGASISSRESQSGDRVEVRSPGRESEADGTPPVPVHAGSFLRRDISSTLKVYAKLEAVERADVYPEISGVVKEVRRREGDRVAKGDVVVLLQDEELRLTAETKKALWGQHKSRIELADLSAQEQARTVEIKRLLAEKAGAEFERFEPLYREGAVEVDKVISKEELEAKRYAYEEAKIAYETARIQERKAIIDHTLAVQMERQSELEHQSALYQHSRTRLVSPIDGAITFLELKPGELLSSTRLAFKVVNNDRLEVKLFVPQRELPQLKRGQRVVIVCQVFEGKTFEGHVDVINTVVDDEGMVRVIVTVSDPSGFLKPGMFINGEILLETHENALLVPKRAILYENQDAVVYLVQDRIARRYVIREGLAISDAIEVLALVGRDGEVLKDVPEKGSLVLMGQNNLKDGSRVESTPSPFEGVPPAPEEGPAEPSVR